MTKAQMQRASAVASTTKLSFCSERGEKQGADASDPFRGSLPCLQIDNCADLTADGRATLLHSFHSVLDLMKSTLWTPGEYVLICRNRGGEMQEALARR